MDFAVSADHRIKPKESEKKDKHVDLSKELKKLWNIKVAIIPIVIVLYIDPRPSCESRDAPV